MSNPSGIHAESNATPSGFHRSSSHARTPAPVNPTRPDPVGSSSTSDEYTSKVEVLGRRNGPRRLRDYLSAPDSVQASFDARIRQQLAKRDELRDWEADLAADPIAQRVQRNRDLIADALGLDPEPATLEVAWDARWQRRAANARNRRVSGRKDQRPYDREELLALDLREVWEDVTGDPVFRGRASCPNPEHEDRNPACGVRESDWRCFACGAHGTVVDLAAIVWGIEPFGIGFFQIRDRLMNAIGAA